MHDSGKAKKRRDAPFIAKTDTIAASGVANAFHGPRPKKNRQSVVATFEKVS